MKKLHHLIILSSFLAVFLLLPFLQSASAHNLALDVPLAGKWVGEWERTMNMENCISDPCVKGTATYIMPMMLRVSEDGTITEGLVSIEGTVIVDVAELGYSNTCEATAEYDVTGGSATLGGDGLPVFDVKMTALSSQVSCTVGGNMGGGDFGGSYDFQLPSTQAAGSTVMGEEVLFADDKMGWGVQQMIQAGFSITIEESWDLTNTSPFLQSIEPEYERYFLESIPFENTYQVTVDWNNNAPGKVIFEFSDGQTQEVPASGEEVALTYDLAGLSAGQTTLEATAYTSENDPSVARDIDITIVPVPAWGKSANFTVSQTPAPHVIYKGSTDVPAEPLKLPFLNLTGIPLVDGKWGVPSIQVPVDLLVTSAGGQSEAAPMEGQFELYLGGQEANVELEFEGETITNLQPEALTIHKSQLETTLPIFNQQKSVGLLDLVPAMQAIQQAPIIGDLAEAINGILAINGTLNVNVEGLVDVAPNQAGNELTFTEGFIKPKINAAVRFRTNFFNLASAWVGGGGAGSFTMQIAPKPRWEDCYLAMNFTAGARVVGMFDESYTKEWPLSSCTGTALTTHKVLAANYAAMPLRLSERPADWQPEQAVLEYIQLNGVDQTTLVTGASTEASPALALGPENRLAFVWVSEDPNQPRYAAKEISMRLYDGTEWGDSLPLTENATFDSSPAVAFDRAGRVVVAWVQNKQDELPADMAFDDAFVGDWEIAYLVIDPQTGDTETTGTLTDDALMDFNPQLARGQDGTLWLAWINSPGKTLTGNSAQPNQVMTARWDGRKWSEPESAFAGLVGTLTWKLAAYDEAHALIAADMDSDGDLSSAQDREIILIERAGRNWEPVQQITRNDILEQAPLATFTPEGVGLLAWEREGQIYGLAGDWQAAPQLWMTLDEPSALLNAVLLAGANDERILLWPDKTAGMDVRFSRYQADDGAWSAPEAFLNQPRQAGSLTAGITAQGDLVVGLAAFDTFTETLPLSTGETVEMPGQPETADLVLAGVTASFTPQEPLIIDDVPLPALPGLASDSSGDGPRGLAVGGVLMVCCIGVAGLLLAGGLFFWWYTRRDRT